MGSLVRVAAITRSERWVRTRLAVFQARDTDWSDTYFKSWLHIFIRYDWIESHRLTGLTNLLEPGTHPRSL